MEHTVLLWVSHWLLGFHLESKIRKNGYIKVVITVRTDVEVSSNLLCVVYSHVCSCNLRHKNCSHPQRAVPQCFIAAVHYKVRAKDVHSSSYFVELWESVMSRNSCDCFKVSFLIITWQFWHHYPLRIVQKKRRKMKDLVLKLQRATFHLQAEKWIASFPAPTLVTHLDELSALKQHLARG